MRLGDIFVVLLIFLWRLLGNVENAEWSQWSACSVSCGSGAQQRDFICKNKQCDRTETRLCETIPCPVQSVTENSFTEALLQGGKNNLALINHHIKEKLVSSEIECALYCQRLLECRSINVGGQKDFVKPKEGSRSLVCQLNNATAEMAASGDLVAVNGAIYYSFLSRQSKN